MEIIKYIKDLRERKVFDSFEEEKDHLYKTLRIKSKNLGERVILKYERDADHNNKIPRECRGLILNWETLEVISAPFEKFFNLGEPYAHNDIDISSSTVLEKVDGTCMVMYYYNEKWRVQTLFQIEAEEEINGWTLEGHHHFKWSSLFWNTFKKYTDDSFLDSLDTDYSYVFELCTPYNKVVVRHEDDKLYFLGQRNKKTLEEVFLKDSKLYNVFEKVKTYDYGNIETIQLICDKELTDQEEGFVIVDSGFRKIKMKGREYRERHYDSTVITLPSVVKMVFKNLHDDWVSVNQEYQAIVDTILEEMRDFGRRIDDLFEDCISKMKDKGDLKEFSLIVKGLERSPEKSFMFALFRKKHNNGLECISEYCSNEDLSNKVKKFIRNSNVAKKIKFNELTGSLR